MNYHRRQSCYDDDSDYYHPSIHEPSYRCFDCDYERRKSDLRVKCVRDEWDGKLKEVLVCVKCIADDWARWRDA